MHITDPHLFGDPAGELRGAVTLQTFRSVLRHAAASAWKPDLIALTGDLIQDDSREAYEHFPALFPADGPPVLCLPGNHDIPALMSSVLGKPPFRYCATIDSGSWRIISINSVREGSAGGFVSDDELQRLEAELSDAPEHALVCLHHPPVAVTSAWLETVGLKNRDSFNAVIAGSDKPRAVLFGHVHQAIDEQHDGVQVIGTPSTCRQFMPGSESFAVDDRPPAYRQLELNDDGTIESTLVWVEQEITG